MFDDLTGFAALNYSFSLSSASLWIAPFAALTAHGSLSPSHKKSQLLLAFLMAGGEGFEPPLAESESAVLPLDDPPRFQSITLNFGE